MLCSMLKKQTVWQRIYSGMKQSVSPFYMRCMQLIWGNWPSIRYTCMHMPNLDKGVLMSDKNCPLTQLNSGQNVFRSRQTLQKEALVSNAAWEKKYFCRGINVFFSLCLLSSSPCLLVSWRVSGGSSAWSSSSSTSWASTPCSTSPWSLLPILAPTTRIRSPCQLYSKTKTWLSASSKTWPRRKCSRYVLDVPKIKLSHLSFSGKL